MSFTNQEQYNAISRLGMMEGIKYGWFNGAGASSAGPENLLPNAPYSTYTMKYDGASGAVTSRSVSTDCKINLSPTSGMTFQFYQTKVIEVPVPTAMISATSTMLFTETGTNEHNLTIMAYYDKARTQPWNGSHVGLGPIIYISITNGAPQEVTENGMTFNLVLNDTKVYTIDEDGNEVV